MREIQVFARKPDLSRDVEINLAIKRDQGGWDLGKPIQFEHHPAGNYIVDPTLRLSVTAAQQLMDELWNCGLRPSEGTGSAGSLAATQAHLKDMQAISFGLLQKMGVQPNGKAG